MNISKSCLLCFSLLLYSFITNASITLFDDPDFNGAHITITNDIPSLSAMGSSYDNMASSLVIKGNYAAELYEGNNYTGEKRVFALTTPLTGLENKISSVKIKPVIGYLFEHYSNTGRFIAISGDTPSLNKDGYSFDNIASSLKINDNYIVELYEHENYQGNKLTLTKGRNLDDFNDKVSSIKIRPVGISFYNIYNGTKYKLTQSISDLSLLSNLTPFNNAYMSIDGNLVVELYDQINFTGNKKIYRENDYIYNFGYGVKSIKINNAPVILYDQTQYSGEKVALKEDTPDLDDLSIPFANRTSSIEIENGFSVEIFNEKYFSGLSKIFKISTNLSTTKFFNSLKITPTSSDINPPLNVLLPRNIKTASKRVSFENRTTRLIITNYAPFYVRLGLRYNQYNSSTNTESNVNKFEHLATNKLRIYDLDESISNLSITVFDDDGKLLFRPYKLCALNNPYVDQENDKYTVSYMILPIDNDHYGFEIGTPLFHPFSKDYRLKDPANDVDCYYRSNIYHAADYQREPLNKRLSEQYTSTMLKTFNNTNSNIHVELTRNIYNHFRNRWENISNSFVLTPAQRKNFRFDKDENAVSMKITSGNNSAQYHFCGENNPFFNRDSHEYEIDMIINTINNVRYNNLKYSPNIKNYTYISRTDDESQCAK